MDNPVEVIPNLDEETAHLWDGGIIEFEKKGGFSQGLKWTNDKNTKPALDLESYLPKFSEIQELNVKTQYIVQMILVNQAVIVLHAPGGAFKTWLALKLGTQIAKGLPFAGLKTHQIPVYYADYENPFSLICDRAKILGPSDMRLWHNSNEIPPPRLDSREWSLFKALTPGLLIIDTLRSSQLLDTNSDRDMAIVMTRMKELRELGFTVLILHHTPKINDKIYKGATAISDLADCVLSLERVREVGSDRTVDDEEADENCPFRLSSRKTRFEPCSIYLRFDPSEIFIPADNPDFKTLDTLRQILSDSNGDGLNQTKFFEAVKELGIKRSKFRRLLKKGEGEYWEKLPISYHNSLVYRAIFPVSKSVVQGDSDNCQKEIPKVIENIELFSCPEGKKTSEISGSSGSCSVVSPFIRVNNRQLTELQEQDNCQEPITEEEDEGE
jgi:hypothetical protein